MHLPTWNHTASLQGRRKLHAKNLGKSLCWTRCTSQSKTWKTRISAPCKGTSRSFKPSLEGHWLVTSWGFALFAAWRSGTDFSWTPHAPPGYKSPTVEQILRADRAGWIRIAEKVDGLRRRPDGTLPLDEALDNLKTDPTTIFHMMPLPMPRAADKPTKPAPIKKDGAPDKTPKPNNFSKGKGKGKNRGKANNKGRMPVELVGLNQMTKTGKRICYNYNLSRGCNFAEAGKDCNKGSHVCMKCFGLHPVHQCPPGQAA